MVNKYFGHYEITGEIGQGGMGVVFRAYDPQLERAVAVKVLPGEYLNDLGFRARFEREAQTVAALDHPAIVPVFEFGEHEGRPYIAMQHMPNGSLADRLVLGPLPIDQAGTILERVGEALDYAHSLGVVHLDLKPNNILFDQSDNAFLADFGIALQERPDRSSKTTISGTPAYVSPEQARKEASIDGRSDIYSLGIVLFEMLTGKLPFEGDSPFSIVTQHVYDSPPAINSVNPNLPPALEVVFRRALAKDPGQRFQTAVQFTDAYRSALDLAQVESHPPGTDLPALLREQVENQEVPLGDGGSQYRPSLTPQPPLSPNFERERRREAGRQQLMALSLVTWLGVLCAVLTAALVRGPQWFSAWGENSPPALLAGLSAQASNNKPGDGALVDKYTPPPNIQVIYVGAAATVINISPEPLSLEKVIFRRPSRGYAPAAAFSASYWKQVTSQPVSSLPAGDCYLLLRADLAPIEINPGSELMKPPGCNSVRGWLVALDPGWHFWISVGDSDVFQVVDDGRLIHTCRIAERQCEFYLPQP